LKAEIISVGTELLLGHIVDTNAAYLAQELSALGIDLYWGTHVGDNLERVTETFRRAMSRSDFIIVTGGLGPTEDDLTRESIAAALGEEMVVVPKLEGELREFFARRGRPMPERNVKQATLIPSARVVSNPIGTAPGWWVERDGTLIAAMPGVPNEMYRMWQNEIVPRLLKSEESAVIHTRIVKVLGIGESHVEEIIQPLLASTNPTLATYAKSDGIHVRITAKAPSVDEARRLLVEPEGEIRRLLGAAIYGVDDETIEAIVLRQLESAGKTLACIEAITGGSVSAALTNAAAGDSVVFRGGLVADSIEAKAKWGIDPVLMESAGEVSAGVSESMATLARRHFDADVGIGVTGVAGPEPYRGQTPGSIHLAIDDQGQLVCQSEIGFGNTPSTIKSRTVVAALDLLRRHLAGGTAVVS
jgi:nicotinamide-nucleotide amidase